MRPLIAGNWKMNLLHADAVALASGLSERRSAEGDPGCDILVCPPYISIPPVASAVSGEAVSLGAQDCHAGDFGAHTGDVNCAMLKDAGCDYVIVGHSERRADHGESDEIVCAKAAAVIAAGMTAIVCIGEKLDEREAEKTLERVAAQIAGSVPEGATADNLVIAYEPVWAIGTGLTPTIDQIAEVHAEIRARLASCAGNADGVRILYGGSMNPGNAAEILAVDNVNGGLVGGASLKLDDFWSVCSAAS